MKRIRFLISLGLVICAVVSGVFFSNMTASASSQSVSTIDILCEQYTSTITPNGVNIYEYINDFNSNDFQKKYESMTPVPAKTVNKGAYFQNNNIFEKKGNEYVTAKIDGDDNIIKIIPKELFTSVGDKLYIGDKYGFYINTFQRAGKNYFESTVILIDVIKVLTGDYSFDITIQPLVQIDYCYYQAGNNQNIQLKNYSPRDGQIYNNYANNCFVEFNGVDNAVIPMIRNDYDTNGQTGAKTHYMQYKESTNFSLSDISFAASLYNCNSLNYGDAGYNAINDQGYFFNGTTYEYHVTKKKNGSTQLNVNEIGNKLIDKALGAVPVLGTVYEIMNGTFGAVNSIVSAPLEIKYNETNKNYYCPELILAPTPQGQIDAYGNLIKYSQMIINSEENDRVLFETGGDYAKGTFKLSKTSGASEYTSLNVNIALKVINNLESSKPPSCLISNTTIIEINQPVPKVINAFENYGYYMLPGLTQKFSFTPVANSNYILLPNNSGLQIRVNNETLNAVSGQYVKKMLKNQTYIIELINTGTSTKTGMFSLDCPSIFSPFDVSAGEEYMVKLANPTTSQYILTTQEIRMLILKIFTIQIGISKNLM